MKHWVGKWVEHDGYWIKISLVDNKINFERSGFKSELTLISLSENTLVYDEKHTDVHSRHTLTYVSKYEISDEWFDVLENRLWQVIQLKKEDSPKEKLPNIIDTLKDEEKNNIPEIIYNESAFDHYQHKLVELFARNIFDASCEFIENKNDVAQLTDNILFSLCSILDGVEVQDIDEKPFIPLINFSLDDDRQRVLSHIKKSWMHEYAIGMADAIIEKEYLD